MAARKKVTESSAAAAAEAPSQATEQTAQVYEEPKKIIPKEVDLNQYITVINGFHGTLVYRSRRTGETFTWGAFGDEQEIELRELRNVKNSAKSFYVNNWFMFPDEYSWVIDFLGLGQFYKHAVSIDRFDEIFTKTPAAIKKAIGEMSNGQKRSLIYRALDLIESGDIDSRKTIAALEDALGVELIEK